VSKGMRRTLVVAGAVGAAHVAALGAVLLVQGCGTTREAAGRPPEPVMPVAVAPVVAPVAKPRMSPPPPPPPASTITHVVAKNETLSGIAWSYEVSVRDVAALNGIANPNKLRVGQKLLIPGTGRTVPRKPVAKPKPVVKPATTGAGAEVAVVEAGTYVVASGDCLSVIAVKHGVTTDAIKKANALTSDRINVGQKLVIPGDSSKPESVEKPVIEPVLPPLPGATNVQDVPAVGALPMAPVLPPSGAATLPTAKAAPSAAGSASSVTHEVQPGEDLYSVSLKYGASLEELQRINGLTGTTLQEGMRLNVPVLER